MVAETVWQAGSVTTKPIFLSVGNPENAVVFWLLVRVEEVKAIFILDGTGVVVAVLLIPKGRAREDEGLLYDNVL